MATELLVGDRLTEDMIAAGGHVVQALDRLNVIVKGAFWFLLPDQKVWRLIISSPEVRISGPKAVYRKVTAALKRIPLGSRGVDIKDITVVSDRDPLVQLIGSLIRTGAGIAGIRMSKNVINGRLIDDMYVYRMT
ncbi:MAG: hypothetical protein AB7G13_29985 [Lautropia sp.]